MTAVDDAKVAGMVAAVREYALEHYEDGKCWDMVIECLDEAEIVGYIGRARTTNGAIWAVWNKFVRIHWQCRPPVTSTSTFSDEVSKMSTRMLRGQTECPSCGAEFRTLPTKGGLSVEQQHVGDCFDLRADACDLVDAESR